MQRTFKLDQYQYVEDFILPERNKRSRVKERKNVKRQRMMFVKSLVGRLEVAGVNRFELTTGEFLFFTIIQQVNLNYLMQFVDLAMLYGVLPTTMAYIFFHITIGMPLYMLCTFMSSYTKRSFVTFWDCIPITQGFGFVLCAMRLMTECRNVLSSCLGFLMVYNVIVKQSEMLNTPCMGPSSTEKCIMLGESYNVTCTNATDMVLISTQYVLRLKQMGFDRFEGECCTFRFYLYGVIIGLWICIFLLTIFGIDRLHHILFRIQMCAVILVTPIALYAFVTAKGFIRKPIFLIKESFQDFQFWVDTAMQSNMPGNLGIIFWMGTLKPRTLHPVTATLSFCPLKIAICTAFMCFTTSMVHGILSNYNFEDYRCLVVSGFDVFLAFVPDIIFTLRFGILIGCLWLVAISVLGMSSTVFTILAIVDSFCERYPNLNVGRIFVYLSFCLFCILLNAPLALNINFTVLHSWTSDGMVLLASVTLLLINVTMMYLYSTNRIIDDYSFTFGSLPHEYWISVWKTTPIICLYGLIFVLYDMKDDNREQSAMFTAITYVVMSAVLLPVVVVALINICQELKNTSLGSLLKPGNSWGPYNNMKRVARVCYFPQRDMKYRSTQLRCTHRCTANSIAFSDEHSKQMKHLHHLIARHRDVLHKSFDDFMHQL